MLVQEVGQSATASHYFGKLGSRYSLLLSHKLHDFLWSGGRNRLVVLVLVGLDENGEQVEAIVLWRAFVRVEIDKRINFRDSRAVLPFSAERTADRSGIFDSESLWTGKCGGGH